MWSNERGHPNSVRNRRRRLLPQELKCAKDTFAPLWAAGQGREKGQYLQVTPNPPAGQYQVSSTCQGEMAKLRSSLPRTLEPVNRTWPTSLDCDPTLGRSGRSKTPIDQLRSVAGRQCR